MNTFLHDSVPPIQTEQGLLHGYKANEIYTFKGVKYAQAKRFQAPMPPEKWDGIREATSYGYVCPLLTQDNPTAELMVPHRYWPMDENCQNLNIWTKSIDKNAKKPVMVWLHGGGFTAGSSIEQIAYDGAALCIKSDVVVVSVNHRLNVLGYLDLSPFGEKYANSANAGHADLVAALKWINANIAAFGGDADNVTIFGQSGGGMKATGLMQIAEADGLFHRAIVMSGVSDGKLMPEPKGDGREIVNALMLELGIKEVQELETVPYHDLAKAYNKIQMPLAMKGVYTGGAPLKNEFYAGEPLLHGFTEHAKTISLMVGSVFGEFSFAPMPFDKAKLSKEQADEILQKTYGENTDKIVELFAKAYPQKNLLDVLVLDRIFRDPSKKLAQLHAKWQKAPTYLYNFIYDFPIWNNKPAWHCADIPFFFSNNNLVDVCSGKEASVLENQISTAATQFAKTANPNHSALVHWPMVTPSNEPTMIFDTNCYIADNYDDELLAFMDKVLPPFNLMKLMQQDIQH